MAFKMNIISLRKRIVDMDVVNDVTCTCQSVITRVVIRFYDMTLSTEQQRRHVINLIYLISYNFDTVKLSGAVTISNICFILD